MATLGGEAKSVGPMVVECLIGQGAAESQYRFGVAFATVSHARSFAAFADEPLAVRFDHAAADGQARGAVLRVAHALGVVFQVAVELAQHFPLALATQWFSQRRISQDYEK